MYLLSCKFMCFIVTSTQDGKHETNTIQILKKIKGSPVKPLT